MGISQVKIKSGMNRSSSLFYCFADCRGELSVTRSSELIDVTYCAIDTIHLSTRISDFICPIENRSGSLHHEMRVSDIEKDS